MWHRASRSKTCNISEGEYAKKDMNEYQQLPGGQFDIIGAVRSHQTCRIPQEYYSSSSVFSSPKNGHVQFYADLVGVK